MNILRVGIIFYGLGNQMMSYLYYKARKELTGEKIVLWAPTHRPLADHNGFELNRIFGINAVNQLISELFWLIYKHKDNRILRRLVSCQRDTFKDLSEKRTNEKLIHFILAGDKDKDFYTKRRAEIQNIYTFNEKKLNKDSANWAKEIENTINSCSLHVRRGDYIGHPNFDNICTISYYRNAIMMMKDRTEDNTCFFIFSDDIAWCKEIFGNKGFKYIDCNHGKDSWQDMFLISRCKHHIMANSTFSWWGSFLGERDGSLIICPPQFTVNDHGENYPPEWIRCKN